MQPFSEEELQQMKISAAQGAKDRAIWKQMQDDEATWSSRASINWSTTPAATSSFTGPIW
jgi:hypothetical protein